MQYLKDQKFENLMMGNAQLSQKFKFSDDLSLIILNETDAIFFETNVNASRMF